MSSRNLYVICSHSLETDSQISSSLKIFKQVCLNIGQAVTQMEERLTQFLESNQLDESIAVESDGAARFVHHQVLELGRDCLQKSKAKLISSNYFHELNDNLERLCRDVCVYILYFIYHISLKTITFFT